MSSSSRPTRKVPKGDYIETDSGNKVSRKAYITGTQNITLAGKTVLMNDVHLRGDLVRAKPPPSSTSEKPTSNTSISIGKYTIISTSTILRPATRLSRGVWTPYPLKIGDQVFIGPNCLIQAALIHSHVHIGANCVLQPFCIVRENVKVLDGTVVPGGMVIPPGVVVGGRPGRIIGEVGEGWGVDGTGEGWVEGGDLREVVRSIK